MPTYEYACKDCGSHIEVVQRFTDDPLTECHACGGRLRKVFGSIGIAFKGSGFYRTDSRAGASGAGGSKPAAGGASSESGSTDAKPASSGSSDSGSSGSGSSGSSGSGSATSAKSA